MQRNGCVTKVRVIAEHNSWTFSYQRLEVYLMALDRYRICLICHALHVRRRGARQWIQNLRQVLNLPPVASTFDRLHISTAGKYNHMWNMLEK